METPSIQHVSLPASSTTRPRYSAFNRSFGIRSKKAIHCLSLSSSDMGFYSNLFAISKKGGGWQPVINLKKLNTFICVPHFKTENFNHLKDILLPSDFLVKLDIKDAYLTVPMDQQFWKHLHFLIWKGVVFEFKTLFLVWQQHH